MKYRVLSPEELEVYNIGYQVGSQQLIITDVEWESDAEKTIYRKGYYAGFKALKRNCVQKSKNNNNVNKSNNVHTETTRTMSTISTPSNSSRVNAQDNTIAITMENTIATAIVNSEQDKNISTARAREKKTKPILPVYQEIADYLADNLSVKLNRKISNRGWADEIRKLCEAGNIDPPRVKDALEWHFRKYDRPYRIEIQSARTLREKFSRLETAYMADEPDLPV